MANSDKNIVIIPNRNLPGQPNVVFTGNANVPITLRVADDNSLSFENVTGQLFSISNNVTSGSIFSVNDISGIPVINVDASGNISLSAFGGNVGIGTASPTSPLHVFGNIRIGNTSTISGVLFPDGTFQSTASSPGAFSASNVTVTSTTTNATFYPTFVESTTGNIGIRADSMWTFNPNTNQLSLTGNAWIQNSGSFGNVSITNTTASTSLTTGALTVAGGVGISGNLFAGSNVLATGSVGIGLTTYIADNPLSVQKGDASTTIGGSKAVIKVNNPGGILSSTTGIEFFETNDVNSNIGRLAGIYGLYKSYNASGLGGELVFATNTAGDATIDERMRITATGLVGIGTTITNALLEVGTFNTSNPNIITGSLEVQPYALNNAHIGENVYYDGSKFAYRRTGAAGLLYFAGNHGGFRWAASGTAGANAGMASYQLKTASDGTFAVGPAVSGSAGVYTGATLFVNPTGQVGIGTSSVYGSAQLTVIGNVYTESSAWIGNLVVTNTTASTSSTTGALTVAGGVGVAGSMIAGGLVQGANLNVTGSNLPSNGLYLPTANTLGFATNSTEKMRINSSGNVGIGLTNPLATLHSGNSLTDANFTFSTVGAIITSKVTNQRSAQSNVLVLSRSGQSGIVYAGLAMFDMSAWQFDSVWARTQLDIKLSNTLSHDLTNVITFRSDGRVGIGSSVPAQTLDVVGTVAISSNLTVGGTIFGVVNTAINASNIVVTSTATNATFYPAFVEATSGNIGIRADSMLTFNPNTNQLSLTGNAAIQNSLAVGNLSITNTTASTSTTTGALTVAGGVGISGSIQVLGSVNAINANINSSSSTVPINGIWSPAANTLGFSTGGSERARIDSNGNLSIGTSTSTWNTVPARASVFGAKDLTNSAGGAGDQLAIVDSSTAAQGVGGGINLFGNYTGTTPALGAMIDTYKSNSTAGNFGFDLRFHTRLHGTALIQERMRITSTGGVSIGLTANQNMLDVVGGVAIGNYAGNVAAGSNNLIISGQVGIGTSNPSLRGSTTDLVLGKPSTDAGLWIAMNREGTSNVGIGASSGYMQFYVDTLSAGYAWSINGSGYSLLGGYNAMYLRNGKLLVGGGGPSSASSNVDVYGNMVIGRIYAGNSATSGPADGLAVQGQVGIGTTVLATAAKLQIEGNVYVANSSVLVGNISVTNTTISTSTTTGALTVAGGVGVVGNVFAGRISTANSGQFGNIGISNTTSSISTSTGALIVQGGIGIAGNVYTSNAYITSNVGIGTSDLIGSVVRIYANNSTDTLRIRQDGTGNSLVISDTANDTTPFIIDRDGKVGIGTFPPNDKLEVWGNVRITESSRIGNLSITNATVSTSTTTGALIVQGGIGVVGNVFAGRISTANSGQFGNVGINNTTVSTSTTTGALTVAGGVGIANGIVTAGNVGIGTSSTTGYTNNALAVFGRALNRGNIYVTNSSTISGIMFSDGTFQNTAAYRSAQTVISYTTANSSTTTFSSSPYTSANSYVQLYVNGVYQPSAYYTWSGTTVTTTTPAPNGAVVELVITTASTLTTSVTFAQTLAAVSLRL